MTTNPGLPSYERPPVTEVVCGVQFEPIDLLMTHLGMLFQRYQPDYPGVTEAAPLTPIVEKFGDQPGPGLSHLEFPGMARTWFVSQDETGIVQVQRDRFLHNWKKERPTDDYPRYENVIKRFEQRLDTFRAFLRDIELGELKPVQYELTYVNHIAQGEGWKTTADMGHVFPDFTRVDRDDRFLPALEFCTWRTAFQMPRELGRLHVTIRNATRASDQKPVLVFEITARGFPSETTEPSMWGWFDLAHEWIVRGFTDLTADDVQRHQWRRTR